MSDTDLQKELFNVIKNVIPAHVSMVDAIADLLNISYDSVYRRIRGEKPIQLHELKILCEHFNLSLDQVLQLKSDKVLFQAPALGSGTVKFADYLRGVLDQFKYFSSFEQKEMFNLCKDLMLWDFYLFPEMASFKTFFWAKTIHNDASLRTSKFSLKEDPFTDCFEIGQQILKAYKKIPTTELWNLESINSTINQIGYYKEAGLFKSKDDFTEVVNSFHKMLDHLQLQAEKGIKFMPGTTEISGSAPVKLYINELIIGNNTYLLLLDGKLSVTVTYGVLSFMTTQDARFSQKAFESFNTLLSRATLVSGTGEKDRNKLFNAYREKVEKMRD